MNKIYQIIKLMRPHHYIKNGLLFLPLIFSGNLLNKNLFIINLLGFFVFCFSSSTIYIVNDIFDAEKDKKHPKKCKRPIASGKISKKVAWFLVIFLLSTSII